MASGLMTFGCARGRRGAGGDGVDADIPARNPAAQRVPRKCSPEATDCQEVITPDVPKTTQAELLALEGPGRARGTQYAATWFPPQVRVSATSVALEAP
jgi:hypothetical protein